MVVVVVIIAVLHAFISSLLSENLHRVLDVQDLSIRLYSTMNETLCWKIKSSRPLPRCLTLYAGCCATDGGRVCCCDDKGHAGCVVGLPRVS